MCLLPGGLCESLRLEVCGLGCWMDGFILISQHRELIVSWVLRLSQCIFEIEKCGCEMKSLLS